MANKRKIASLVLKLLEVLLVGTCLGLASGRCCVRPVYFLADLPLTFSVELVRTQFVAGGLVAAAMLSLALAAGGWFANPPRFFTLGIQAAAALLVLTTSVLMFMYNSDETQADSRVLGAGILALLTVLLYAADAFASLMYF